MKFEADYSRLVYMNLYVCTYMYVDIYMYMYCIYMHIVYL